MRNDIRQLTETLNNKITVNSFIEIGSRDGHDADYISKYWSVEPNNCYIIEAHPECYNNIIRDFPYFKTFNIVASNKTGVAIFNAGIFGEEDNIGISSVLNRTLDTFISEKVEVDAWRLEELMLYLNINKIDLAKIDVEGFGLQVLEGLGEKLNNFKAIQIELEVKQVWEGQSYYNDVVDYLSKFGFIILDEVDLDGIQKDVLFIKNNI